MDATLKELLEERERACSTCWLAPPSVNAGATVLFAVQGV